ncbi:hypothetical protein RB608_09560 [Nocardioides sp. LHD-245]|uniref:hypothetical protein n=1 Tax=Nocardioides sp. LHD-245 TaxID=3051387 RepID=UPI0027DFC6E9|nr:hypothetical protein [Nocardioides sp. LHD-245]
MRRHVVRFALLGLVLPLLAVLATVTATPALAATDLSGPSLITGAASVAVDPAGNATAVWIESPDGSSYQVRAARRTGSAGAWGVAATVGAPGSLAPAVATGPNGSAILAYTSTDTGFAVILARTIDAGGAWSPPSIVSAPGQNSGSPQLTVGPDGTITIAWSTHDGVNTIVQARRRTPDGTWSAPLTLSTPGTNADGPSLAIDDEGDVVVAWTTSTGVEASRLLPTGWTTPDQVWTGVNASQVRAGAGGTGHFTLAWVVHSAVVGDRVHATEHLGGDDWTEEAYVLSPLGLDAKDVDLDVSTGGNAVVVWAVGDGEHSWIQRFQEWPQDIGGWNDADNPDDESPIDGEAVNPTVRYDADGNRHFAWTQLGASGPEVWSMLHSVPNPLPNLAGRRSPAGEQVLAPSIGLDAVGTVTTLWRRLDPANPLHSRVQIDTATRKGPLARMVAPTLALYPSTAPYGLSWTAGERGAPVASYDLRWREAPWNGTFGPPQTFRTATTATGAPFGPLQLGASYCLSVRARDVDGLEGPWSGEGWGCLTVPLDDRQLKRKGKWKKVKAGNAFSRTLTRSTTKGAWLRINGVTARQLVLRVKLGKKYGKIKVKVSGWGPQTFSLKSKQRGIGTIALGDMGSIRTVNVMIVVKSKGKQVNVDGLYARKW